MPTTYGMKPAYPHERAASFRGAEKELEIFLRYLKINLSIGFDPFTRHWVFDQRIVS